MWAGKIIKRFFESLSLALMPDAPDGSRVALTDAAQTIDGLKTFNTGIRVATDSAAGDYTLINKGEMDTALNSIPTDQVELITLDAAMLAAHEVTLAKPVTAGQEDNVMMRCQGSNYLQAPFDFTVNGTKLSWDGNTDLIGRLVLGDTLSIHYFG